MTICERLFDISIHALREEGDQVHCNQFPRKDISIHALREEGDHPACGHSFASTAISIHALREEGDK